MNDRRLLETLSDRELRTALSRGHLQMHLGAVTCSVHIKRREILPFLQHHYGHARVRTGDDIVHFNLQLDAPSLLRRFIRPQIMPLYTGFKNILPLSTALTPLAFEMGMNLHVALGTARHLLLHAGVVADTSGRAIIMPATSGGGKSTLTALLMQRGYRLLSDEFGIMDLKSGSFHAFNRPVSLKNESIKLIRDLVGQDELGPVYRDTPKGDVAFLRPRPSDFESRTLPALGKVIVYPSFDPNAPKGGALEDVKASDSMLRLISGSTNYKMTAEAGFKRLTKLVSRVPSYSIRYASAEDSLKLLEKIGIAL